MVKYQLVQNDEKYWDFIRSLRNDSRVKTGFIRQEHIQIPEHLFFMRDHGKNFYICLDIEVPVGYIGVINRDIRVATHPDYQGRGVASFMVNEAMKKHPNAFAKVKVDNEASLRLFESCGFKRKYFILER
jgi:ribosomal protein S18 acetylase RimI-like enzyme